MKQFTAYYLLGAIAGAITAASYSGGFFTQWNSPPAGICLLFGGTVFFFGFLASVVNE